MLDDLLPCVGKEGFGPFLDSYGFIPLHHTILGSTDSVVID